MARNKKSTPNGVLFVTSCGAGSNFLEDIKSMLNMIEIS